MRRTQVLVLLAGAVSLSCSSRHPPKPQAGAAPTPAPEASAPAPGINLDEAAALELPAVGDDLKPVSFKTADGREGWIVRMPGNRPAATPAYADGLIFVGGGYGSHEFYAFRVDTGELAWQIRTSDDGPTAAVVEDGLVAFNTESCTIEVVEAATGKTVWRGWLGEPLMSQPAIADGKGYMAYPRGGAGPGQEVTQAPNGPGGAPNAQAALQAEGVVAPTSHKLLCADLRTGKHLWEQRISGDAIVAPVIDDGQVLLTCFDGTSFCLDAGTGAVLWKK